MGIKERKQREKERRRQQIIIAAKRVFSEKGFAKATIDDIASEAELSPGTLYLYFKNKEELYASLSIRILQYLNIRVEHVKNKKNLSPSEKLESLMKAMFDVYEFEQMTIINMFHLQSSETLKNLSPRLMSDINELSRKSLAGITAIFQEGIDQEVFIEKHPVALADIFWSIFAGVILWESSKSIVDDQKNYITETLEIAFEIFAEGIKKR